MAVSAFCFIARVDVLASVWLASAWLFAHVLFRSFFCKLGFLRVFVASRPRGAPSEAIVAAWLGDCCILFASFWLEVKGIVVSETPQLLKHRR